MTDAAKKRNVAVWLLMVLARMHTDSINGLFPIQVISCGEAGYGENHSRKVIEGTNARAVLPSETVPKIVCILYAQSCR